MNNQEFSQFEEKILQAVQLPEPGMAFSDKLWNQIVDIDHLKTHPYTSPQRGKSVGLNVPAPGRWPFYRNSLSRMVLILAIFLAGIIFLFATPTGVAWAQSVITFFTRATSDTEPAPTSIPLVWVAQTPGVPAATTTPQPTLPGPAFHGQCGESIIAARCTVEQIRAKVKFPVKELGTIPEAMTFKGANGGPDEIFIIYDTADHSGGLILDELPWDGGPIQNKYKIGASAVLETVKIGNTTGEYVKGSFGYIAGEALAHWNADADTQVLQWVEDGVFIRMQSFGKHLNHDQFIALASSLTDKPVVVKMTPTLGKVTPTDEPFDFHTRFPLTLPEAEKKAGFKLLAPSSLPEALSFFGARYDPEQKVTTLFYILKDGFTDGLSVSEEIIPTSGVTYLGPFVIGDKTIMDKYPHGTVVGHFDKVQIGKINGEYSEGVFKGTDCCGWQWEADPYLKTLRWQMNGKAFELQYMGMSLDKEDLLKIAVSMK